MSAPVVAAADVGGTAMKLGVVQAGIVLDEWEVPTPRGERAADGVIDIIVDHAKRAVAEHHAAAVGVLVPGVVDDAAGVGLFSENLRWRGVPFKQRIAAATGMPTALGHDVATAGLAEVRLGAARDVRNAAVIVIGTGIAAALVVDGRVLRAGGYAGELGHSVVVPGGVQCVCGSAGCLEAIASAAAIARSYSSRAGERVDGARDVLERKLAGDAIAAAVWQEAVDALAAAIRQLQAAVPSEVVVIGGGLSRAGKYLLDPLREAVDAHLSIQPTPRIVPAALGARAGLIGASIIAAESA